MREQELKVDSALSEEPVDIPTVNGDYIGEMPETSEEDDSEPDTFIGETEVEVLGALVNKGGSIDKQNEIESEVSVTQPTISKAIRRLADWGLVENERDGRAKRVEIIDFELSMFHRLAYRMDKELTADETRLTKDISKEWTLQYVDPLSFLSDKEYRDEMNRVFNTIFDRQEKVVKILENHGGEEKRLSLKEMSEIAGWNYEEAKEQVLSAGKKGQVLRRTPEHTGEDEYIVELR